MADDWCCKGTDPSCDGPQECANRAALLIEAQQAEIERLRAAGDELVASLTPVSFAGPHEAMNRLERAYLAWGEARRG